MDEIQNCIADAQYGQALKDVNATIKPLDSFPVPSAEEYENYIHAHNIDLEFILEAPIGRFIFREYVGRFEKLDAVERYKSILDFLVLMKRIKVMETPDEDAADNVCCSLAIGNLKIHYLSLQLSVCFPVWVSKAKFIEIFAQ